jgi:hypothetical protein
MWRDWLVRLTAGMGPIDLRAVSAGAADDPGFGRARGLVAMLVLVPVLNAHLGEERTGV